MVCVEGDVTTGSYAAEDGSKKYFFNIVQSMFCPSQAGIRHKKNV